MSNLYVARDACVLHLPHNLSFGIIAGIDDNRDIGLRREPWLKLMLGPATIDITRTDQR